MNKEELRNWKKVYADDLSYVCYEIEDLIDKPALIILEGDLGAGKTTFCKEFLKDEGVFSPSYSIITETRNALHADFYRLKSSDEITHLEIPMYLEEKTFFIVEWGMKYIYRLYQDIPENFDYYLMEIKINDSDLKSSKKEEFSRDFFFHRLTMD